MFQNVIKLKDKEREEIRQLTEEFEARGGKINKLGVIRRDPDAVYNNSINLATHRRIEKYKK